MQVKLEASGGHWASQHLLRRYFGPLKYTENTEPQEVYLDVFGVGAGPPRVR